MSRMIKTEDLGNNETRSVGIFESNGRFCALTRTSSRWFKTRKGAERYLQREYPQVWAEITKEPGRNE